MTRRRVPAFIVAFAICLLAPIVASPAGGAADRDSSPQARRGGTLRLHRFRDIDFVDPALAYFPDSWTILYATCAKLYNYPDRGGAAGTAVLPEVAVGYPHLSQGGKVATIRLRRGYRFHTGDPVTAANFVAAFNRDANPRMESPAAAYLHEIRGADAVLTGRARAISGIRAVGRYTLRLVLTQTVPDLASRLTMPFFCPVRVNERIEPGGVENPLGSGPYYVSSLVRNRQLVLRRNPYYRGARPRNVDRVVSTVGGGFEACRAAVDRDEIDYCGGPGIRATLDRADLQKHGVNRPGGRLHFTPTVAMDSFLFNHARPAFSGRGQIPLKQAINYALDRPALARAGGLLGGQRTDQLLPKTLARPAAIFPVGGVTSASLAKANALLGKARFKPRRLVLYAISRGAFPARAQIFQFNLRRIGIDVDIRYFDPSVFYDRVRTRGEPFDVVLWGWVPDYADAAAFFVPLLSGRALKSAGNSNVAYFNRPWVNRRIDLASRLGGAARRKAWADLDVDLMRRDPPGAPFLSGARVDLVSPSLGCFLLHPVVGGIDIAAACKK